MSKRSRFLSLFSLILVVVWAGCSGQPRSNPNTKVLLHSVAEERAAIHQALAQATADDSPAPASGLALEQVALDPASGYALVTWTRGDSGGQAVLQKSTETWAVLDHGNGWLGLQGLEHQGVPDEVSKRLLDQIDPNWPSYGK